MRSKPLYREVSEEIMDLIDTSDFPVGARLPSVRDLATKFGVCRAVIRQALIALEAREILEVKEGSGIFVSDRFNLSSYGSPEFASFELIEALALVEAEVAAFAAPIISNQSILELEEVDQIISEENRRDMMNILTHFRFHNLIVRSTNNKILISMTETLWKVQNSEIKLRNAYLEVFRSRNTGLSAERLAILSAFKSADSEGARRATRAYFSCVMEALLAASEARAYRDIKRRTSKKRTRFLLSIQSS